MTVDGRLAGRVAVVTGASRGIGLAAAARLLGDGAQVVVTARHPEGLDDALAELTAIGGADRVATVAGRADDPDHQQAAAELAVARFGRLDILVNNAGINPAPGPIGSVEPGAARKTFEVNVLAVLGWLAAARQAGLGDHDGAAVVMVSSVAGVRAAPGVGWYGVTKAALISLTEQLALELSPGIRVNAVAPGVVRTRFAAALYAHDEEGVAAGYPLGRLGEPADVGAAIAFLAGPDAAWITGQTLVIDGGLTLRGGV